MEFLFPPCLALGNAPFGRCFGVVFLLLAPVAALQLIGYLVTPPFLPRTRFDLSRIKEIAARPRGP